MDFSGLILEKNANGSYLLSLQNRQDGISGELIFEPRKPPVRQGKNGLVSGPNNEQMFYYSISRCHVQGDIQYQDQPLKITEGQGWFDHEFGVNPDTTEAQALEAKIGWTWMSIQLHHDYEVSLYCLYDLNTHSLKNLFCTVINPSGQQQFYDNTLLDVMSTWKSLHTFCKYGNAWNVQIPNIELDIEIRPLFEEQEFITIISYPAFWEGRCDVKGRHQGQPVTGVAYVEQTNLSPIRSIDDFFSSVSEEVSKEIQYLLPLDPDCNRLLNLIASEENAHLLEGIDLAQFVSTVIAPIRTMSDRSAKRWRSYALIACCHLVGGDFKKFRPWLAVPELIHTGSLIIDDIQDKSPIRRGGPSCHTLFGEPLAINAGTLAYGLFHVVLKQTELSSRHRCKVYDLYFDVFRAAHTGQAIDIDGHLDLMAECIQTKDFKKLQDRVLAVHRLKSAIPAASLARMGAILGHATELQVAILGNFFESVGLAFQIMDDVLNLKGFKNNLKLLAEDIIAGKVTYPIAKSLEYLDTDELQWIWGVLANESTDTQSHQMVIERLESCGALEACCTQARSIVDTSWSKLDTSFAESHTKMMLRAFSCYVINRHY